MSTTKTIVVRVSAAEHRRLSAEAAEAGVTLSDLARQRLGVEGGDGRARRWAALRAEVRGLLRAQLDEALELLAGKPCPQREVALAFVARSLGLGRPLAAEEAGVVADVAAAELAVRREAEGAPDDDES